LPRQELKPEPVSEAESKPKKAQAHAVALGIAPAAVDCVVEADMGQHPLHMALLATRSAVMIGVGTPSTWSPSRIPRTPYRSSQSPTRPSSKLHGNVAFAFLEKHVSLFCAERKYGRFFDHLRNLLLALPNLLFELPKSHTASNSHSCVHLAINGSRATDSIHSAQHERVSCLAHLLSVVSNYSAAAALSEYSR
jgi:hypothetical protein